MDQKLLSTQATNATLEYSVKDEAAIVLKVVFSIILVVIMFGMGCAVTHEKLMQNLKRPVGVGIGLVSQIIIMPLATHALIKIFNLPTTEAIAFMLVGCSPGGTNSNVVTYMVKGDIALSVIMTVISNMLAMGTVPFWILVFTSIERIDDELKIPYSSFGISLASMTVPVILGVAFGYKFPEPSKSIPKICCFVALIVSIATFVVMIALTKVPFIFSTETFLPVVLLPFAGMIISYLLACVPQLKLNEDARKAISVETAVQTGGLANSVLILTYGDQANMMSLVMVIPLLFQVFQSSYALLIIIIHRIIHHQKNSCTFWRKAEATSRADGDSCDGASEREGGEDDAEADRSKERDHEDRSTIPRAFHSSVQCTP